MKGDSGGKIIGPLTTSSASPTNLLVGGGEVGDVVKVGCVVGVTEGTPVGMTDG